MKKLILLFALVVASASAQAKSDDRIPLVEGDKETFGMTDLKKGQCSLSVEDLENGFVPAVNLDTVTVRTGRNFLDGIYLTSWTHDNQDRDTFATIQVFYGDEGRQLITVGLELTYRGLADGNYTVKNNQFVALLDENSQLSNFKERLSYEINNSKTYAWVNVPGKSRYDSELKSVAQTADTKQGVVSFQRTTETGLKISVSCNLAQ